MTIEIILKNERIHVDDTFAIDFSGGIYPKGQPGNPGHTPVRGEDYWTDEDKAEMEQDILESQTVTGMQESINALGENKADKVEDATDGNFASLDENGNLQDSGHKHSDYLTQHQDITGKADKVASATAGNFPSLDENGNLQDSGSKASDFLTQHQDISGKADKVASSTEGNFASLDANGNLKDSGHKHSDYLTEHQDLSNYATKEYADKKYTKPATGIPAADLAEGVIPDISGKADKVSSPTNGNFAALDENGNLTDSGHKHSDYLTQHQSISGKADKVSGATSGNFASLDGNGNLQDSGHKHSDYLTQHQSLANYVQKGVIAEDYNPESTYDIGERVMYNGSLYRCKTAISTAEAWNASHWQYVDIDGELSQLSGDLNEITPLGRVSSLDDTSFAKGSSIEAVGIPVYVGDVSEYSAYSITEEGWYVFARVSAPEGTSVTAQTTIVGASGYIATVGVGYVDIAVRFDTTAQSVPVTIEWGLKTDHFTFKASDLAVRNLDYRVTFYIYDIDQYATWTYAMTTDATFVANKQYYTKDGDEYSLATVTVGEAVPANTYYNHSKLTFSGMTPNVTYKLDTVVDCPIDIILPEVADDGHGAWFEIQMRYNATFSCTLIPPTGVKIGTAQTQAQAAGVNTIDLQYTIAGDVKMWTLLNTHSNIPA